MSSDSKKVNIVVVTYNRCVLLEECLNALLQQDYDNFTVYLINNASTDDTEAMVKEKFTDSRIKYYNTGKNIGGAGGFNYGMKLAAADSCDYVWLMDDDTIVEKYALKALTDYAADLNDDFGFLSSYVKYTDGTPCQMNIPTLLGDENNKNRTWLNTAGEKDLEKEIRVIHATFVSFFVKRSVVLDIGLPIRDFFIWGDDTEYSIRISNKYPSYFCPGSIVIHKMNENKATTVDDFIFSTPDRASRYFYKYRNRFYIVKKKGVLKTLRFCGRVVKDGLLIIAKAQDGKAEKLKTLFKGFRKGIRFDPKIEYIPADRVK